MIILQDRNLSWAFIYRVQSYVTQIQGSNKSVLFPFNLDFAGLILELLFNNYSFRYFDKSILTS